MVSTPGRMSGVVGAREVVARTKGRRHGPITRLASPSDLGEMLKPFVFLDYFELDAASGFGFNAHPHSGIATHTTFLDGALDYGDSTGKSGSMAVGNLEWMQAAGGVWHWGQPSPGTPSRGYQLWVALPPAIELAQATSAHIDADLVEGDGRVPDTHRRLRLPPQLCADAAADDLHARPAHGRRTLDL